MIQQINLYNDKFKPNAEANLFKLYLSSLAVPLVLLAAYLGYMHWQTRQFESQLQTISQKNTDAQQLLQDIEQRYPVLKIDNLLLAETSSIKNQVNALNNLFNQLSDTHAAPYQGFSRYLQALAQQSNANAWLSRIQITSGNNAITLQGSTYISASVPKLLQRLQKEPVFRGKKFSRLEMNETPEHPSQINFIVGSQMEEEELKP